jgi:hypothetical protein
MAWGIHPLESVQHSFEWFYAYGAVAPTAGERFFLELPYLHANMCPIFLDASALASPDSLQILLLDNSGAHTVHRPRWPKTVRGVGLPPDCPEPNRIQRVWRGLKDEVALQQCVDLAAHLDAVSHLPQA